MGRKWRKYRVGRYNLGQLHGQAVVRWRAEHGYDEDDRADVSGAEYRPGQRLPASRNPAGSRNWRVTHLPCRTPVRGEAVANAKDAHLLPGRRGRRRREQVARQPVRLRAALQRRALDRWAAELGGAQLTRWAGGSIPRFGVGAGSGPPGRSRWHSSPVDRSAGGSGRRRAGAPSGPGTACSPCRGPCCTSVSPSGPRIWSAGD